VAVSLLAAPLSLFGPVLRVSHAELATELRRSGLPYALDPTNADERYRRNALRAPLAALRGEFPHLDRAVARCAEIVAGQLSASLLQILTIHEAYPGHYVQLEYANRQKSMIRRVLPRWMARCGRLTSGSPRSPA